MRINRQRIGGHRPQDLDAADLRHALVAHDDVHRPLPYPFDRLVRTSSSGSPQRPRNGATSAGCALVVDEQHPGHHADFSVGAAGSHDEEARAHAARLQATPDGAAVPPDDLVRIASPARLSDRRS